MADSISDIISRLLLETKTWSSMEISIHRDQAVSLPQRSSADPYVRTDIHYVESAIGQRFLDEVSTTKGGVRNRLSHYCDGSRCARVFYDKHHEKPVDVMISKDFADEGKLGISRRPIPLYYHYIGLTPLSDALRSAKRLGDGQVIGRRCIVFAFSGVKTPSTTCDMVYYLDAATSLPVRVDAYQSGADHTPERRQSRWEAQSLDDVGGGRHFPLRSEFVIYAREGQAGEPRMKGSDQVVSIKFDATLDASSFWPRYEPGTKVYDTLKRSVLEVPGARPESPGAEAKASPALPLTAAQPRDWSTPIAISGFALGLALLATAFVLKRRGT